MPASVILDLGVKGSKLFYQLLRGVCELYDSNRWPATPQTAVSDRMQAKGMKIPVVPRHAVGRDASVGIATRCGLDGPGI